MSGGGLVSKGPKQARAAFPAADSRGAGGPSLSSRAAGRPSAPEASDEESGVLTWCAVVEVVYAPVGLDGLAPCWWCAEDSASLCTREQTSPKKQERAMSECLFCGVKGQAERLCGCDVCTMCSSGAYSAGLQRWGLELSEERWEETTSGDNPQTRHVLRVTVKYPSTLRLEAHFTREGPLNRVRKFFGHKEMQAGDPLFDRFVGGRRVSRGFGRAPHDGGVPERRDGVGVERWRAARRGLGADHEGPRRRRPTGVRGRDPSDPVGGATRTTRTSTRLAAGQLSTLMRVTRWSSSV